MSNEHLLYIIIAVILIIGLLPSWPYSRSWGFLPSGIVLVLAVVLLFWVFNRTERSTDLGSDTRRSMENLGQDLEREGRKLGRETEKAVERVLD